MKIKSVIKKEETIEKEISLPYFCKYFDRFSDKFTYFKLTEDKVIDAMIGNYTSVSCYSHGVNDRKIAESEQITEQEFNEAYHKALFEIGKYVPVPDVPKDLLNAVKDAVEILPNGGYTFDIDKVDNIVKAIEQ